MASNETLNNLFEMLIDRLNNVEKKCDKIINSSNYKLNKMILKLCPCQISTFEKTQDSFKIITKSPTFNCRICKYGIKVQEE